ncbi:MAG: hypothetical protein J6R82_00045 [Clostridia bacterium]|nr:hypothetical protein [Clostridia bacterium]
MTPKNFIKAGKYLPATEKHPEIYPRKTACRFALKKFLKEFEETSFKKFPQEQITYEYLA